MSPGFKRGLGDKRASMIVAEASYGASDPTVDSQLVTLKASGANVFSTSPRQVHLADDAAPRRNRLDAGSAVRSGLGLIDLDPQAGRRRECRRPDLATIRRTRWTRNGPTMRA